MEPVPGEGASPAQHFAQSDPIPCNELVTVVPVGESDAFKAVRQDNLDALQGRLAEGLDINTVYTEPVQENMCMIRDFGRMVRQIRFQSYTLLHIAVAHGSTKMIEFLLSEGADVNAVDRNLISPLVVAAAIKRPDVVSLLLERGANLNGQTASGRTPLIAAINNKDLATVKLLVAKGADVELADHKGMTPLFMCISAQRSPLDVEIIHILIQGGCAVDKANSRGATALMLSVGFGRQDIADILLEAGADINQMDRAEKRPFDFSAGVNMAKFLMNRGATTDWPDKKGVRAIDRAASNGHIGMMLLLLGSDCRRSSVMLDVPRVVQARQQVPVFNQWLQQELQQPRNLKRLCRQSIRLYLSPSNTKHIDDLPIPQVMKDFLLAKNLDVALPGPR